MDVSYPYLPPTEPIDMRALLHDVSTGSDDLTDPTEPTYGDFLREPSA